MKIATAFRDPQAIAKLHCDALLADALAASPPAFLQPLSIGTKLPTAAPAGRLLIVRSGPWLTYAPPVTATNQLRLVAWSPSADEAWDIASWFHGHLLALAGDSDVVSYRYNSGPEAGVDPDFDTPIAAFTLEVRMRPAIL